MKKPFIMVLLLLLGLQLLFGQNNTNARTGAGAPIPKPQNQSSNIVIDGNARFMVLSPTLIRTEYAGDRAFTDATTFNVINRAFPIPAYTTQVVNGWREIRTDKRQQRRRPSQLSKLTQAGLIVAAIAEEVAVLIAAGVARTGLYPTTGGPQGCSGVIEQVPAIAAQDAVVQRDWA